MNDRLVNEIIVKSIAFLMMILLLSGCSYTVGGKERRPLKVVYKGPVSVKVFFERPANLQYVEVDTVSALVGSPEYNWVQQIEAMQKKAASKGANGIVIVRQERDQESTTAQKELTGIAIRITDRFYLLKAWINRWL